MQVCGRQRIGDWCIGEAGGAMSCLDASCNSQLQRVALRLGSSSSFLVRVEGDKSAPGKLFGLDSDRRCRRVDVRCRGPKSAVILRGKIPGPYPTLQLEPRVAQLSPP